MAVLGEQANISADTVSQRTEVEKSLISRSLKKLISRNLVRRQLDPNDARRHSLRLSATGEDIYHQIVPMSLLAEQEIFSCLSDAEKTRLLKLLTKMLSHID